MPKRKKTSTTRGRKGGRSERGRKKGILGKLGNATSGIRNTLTETFE